MISKVICLATAGAVGTVFRYFLGGFVHRFVDADFPWGTLSVNALGCFLAGFLWIFSERSLAISGELRAVIFIGFFGAFTTFSSVMLETAELLRAAEWAASFKNIMFHNVLGIGLVVLGIVAAKSLKGGV